MGAALGAHGARRLALQVTAIGDVLPTVGVALEAQRDVEQRTDASLYDHVAGRRRVDAGQQAQQRAFAGAVVADDADAVALADAHVHVLERLDFHDRIVDGQEHLADQKFFQSQPLVLANPKRQADSVQFDSRHEPCPQAYVGNRAARRVLTDGRSGDAPRSSSAKLATIAKNDVTTAAARNVVNWGTWLWTSGSRSSVRNGTMGLKSITQPRCFASSSFGGYITGVM